MRKLKSVFIKHIFLSLILYLCSTDPIKTLQQISLTTTNEQNRALLQFSQEEYSLRTAGCDPNYQNCSTPIRATYAAAPIRTNSSQCMDIEPPDAVFDCTSYALKDLCDSLDEEFCAVSCGECCEDVPVPGTKDCKGVKKNDKCSDPDIVGQGFCQKTCDLCGVQQSAQQTASPPTPSIPSNNSTPTTTFPPSSPPTTTPPPSSPPVSLTSQSTAIYLGIKLCEYGTSLGYFMDTSCFPHSAVNFVVNPATNSWCIATMIAPDMAVSTATCIRDITTLSATLIYSDTQFDSQDDAQFAKTEVLDYYQVPESGVQEVEVIVLKLADPVGYTVGWMNLLSVSRITQVDMIYLLLTGAMQRASCLVYGTSGIEEHTCTVAGDIGGAPLYQDNGDGTADLIGLNIYNYDFVLPKYFAVMFTDSLQAEIENVMG